MFKFSTDTSVLSEHMKPIYIIYTLWNDSPFAIRLHSGVSGLKSQFSSESQCKNRIDRFGRLRDFEGYLEGDWGDMLSNKLSPL